MYAGCEGLFFRRVVLGDEDVEEDEAFAEEFAEEDMVSESSLL